MYVALVLVSLLGFLLTLLLDYCERFAIPWRRDQ
jgi:ABC-type nitrate/sulfonate/bicarbonate transport system permease component